MTHDSGRDPLGQALAVPVEPVARLDPSGFDPSRIMRDALLQIRDMEERIFTGWPDDWREQIDACPECQAYANHPIQQGICNQHRQPIYARDKHERHEREAMHWRMASIAREALAAIATEARRAETSSGSVHEGAGLQGIAQPQSVSGLSHTGVDRG